MARTAPPRRMMRPAALAVALLAALPMAVAPVVAQGNTDAPEKKLYRWTDSSGKVHYTDALPADVVNQARAELSVATGLVRSTVDRALTPEERRAAEAEALRAAEAQARVENSLRSEEAKVSSFRTEADLRAAYVDRQKVIDETLESLEAAINSQRGSLHQQLGVAGDAELAGRPVAERTIEVIFELREELQKQEQARVERAAERQVLGEEMERLIVLFRERQAAREREMGIEM
ncbi:DUF4124 domain-containing protein [Silanimonas sp.]|uniref:DUF4124 domain-containing protein n=1 Tax=Silanimonas sp. TaxID=1929290 RepID=UPI0037CA1C75